LSWFIAGLRLNPLRDRLWIFGIDVVVT